MSITGEMFLTHVKEAEGFREKPYKCPAGKLTIGYGFNIEDRGIPEEVAEFWLKHELESCVKELQGKLAGRPLVKTLGSVRGAILTDMAFNMGVPRLLTFKKMFAALDAGDYEKAADEMLDSKWAKQVKGRAVKLSEVMRTGVWT